MTTPPLPPASEAPDTAAQPAHPQGEVQPESQPWAEFPPLAEEEAAPAGKSRLASGVRAVLIFVVAAAVALFAASYFSKDDPRAAQPGNCVHNSGSDSKPDVTVVDCKASNAEFKVLKVVHSSDEKECDTEPDLVATYREERTSSIVILCLGQNS